MKTNTMVAAATPRWSAPLTQRREPQTRDAFGNFVSDYPDGKEVSLP
jgi:hypothetical protein